MMWFPHSGMASGWVWTIMAFAWIAIGIAAYVVVDRRAVRNLPAGACHSPAKRVTLGDPR